MKRNLTLLQLHFEWVIESKRNQIRNVCEPPVDRGSTYPGSLHVWLLVFLLLITTCGAAAAVHAI